MLVAGLHLSANQAKPFNPLLGETCEGYWPDGTRIYSEHISHHPPIQSLLIIGNGFKIFGSSELSASFKGNSMIGGEKGRQVVQFADGQEISFNYPLFKLGGMLMGNRTIQFDGSVTIEDRTSMLSSTLTFGPKKKKGFFSK
jgi:hypothetical protein